MTPDFDRFFREYAEVFNRSLGESVDVDGIREAFADCFVGAGPSGVTCGRNDASFAETLQKGYAFYKSIGTRTMAVRQVEPTAIDDRHHVVRVAYTAIYEKKTGETIGIEFEVTYLLQTQDGRSRIFGFIAGDELAEYRRHGLIDG